MKVKGWIIGLLLLSVVGIEACGTANAEKPRPKAPSGLVMGVAAGTADTLRVYARWQASTVGVPNGTITYPLTWVRNGANIRTATVSVLADTVKFARALIGRSDTVVFSVRALYSANGNMSNWATITRVYANGDLQFPSIPVIIVIDTL